jgi:hypothetical protein
VVYILLFSSCECGCIVGPRILKGGASVVTQKIAI